MSVTNELSGDGKNLEINVSGRFDFKLQKEFRQAYENIGQQLDSCVINLAETSYIDSSGLGMLMVLSEYLKEQGLEKKIEIRKANDTVRELLLLSSMDRLFTVN